MKTLFDNPKRPNKLFVKIRESGEIKETKDLWSCGECGSIFSGEKAAYGCCYQFYCSCGNKRHQHIFKCDFCLDKERLEIAVEVEYKEGMVVLFNHDTYYADWDDMIDSLEADIEEDEVWPEWAQPCELVAWEGINIDHVLENEMERLNCEEVEDQLVDVKELFDFIKQWNAKQSVFVWRPIKGQKIRIPAREKISA